MPEYPTDAKLIAMLLDRLERISADSVWAHRASGLRGGLIRQLEKIEANHRPSAPETYMLIDASIRILENAGREKLPSDTK